MNDYIGPHKNHLAKRAKGRVNAHVDFGMGCAYGPHFSFRGTNWTISIYQLDDGWFVHFPFGEKDQLYYNSLMDLFDDMMDLGAMEDSVFANDSLLTFWLLAWWEAVAGCLPEIPERIKDLADKRWQGPQGAIGQ